MYLAAETDCGHECEREVEDYFESLESLLATARYHLLLLRRRGEDNL